MNRKHHCTKVALLTACIAIAGCGYTVEQLVKDKNLRTKVLKDCVALGLKAKDQDKCLKAAEAQARVTGNSIKSIFK